MAALVTAMVGASPGDRLRQLTAQAAGNPLYVRELVDALLREDAVQISTVAGVSPSWERLPVSLATILDDRLTSVSAETAQLLRTAALLGGRFAVTDLAVVVRRTVADVAPRMQEAVAADIVADAGAELAFRHPLIRQALYESMPEALRTALHAEAARELAAAGADALTVGQQLSAGGKPGEDWARSWLIQAGQALATRAPQLAVELLRRELDETPVGGEAWDALIICLVRALLAAADYPEAAAQASRGLADMTDPVRRGEASWLLAHAQVSAGRNGDAIGFIRQALAAAAAVRPGALRARPDRCGEASRDHAAALSAGAHAGRCTGLPGRLDSRTFTLKNLDEWQRAELALRQSREFAQRTGRADRATWATAAVLRYWLGQWDDALAELDSEPSDAPGLVYSFLRERWSALLTHGVAALIAGRREQRTTARQHLREGLALPIENLTDRENQDFLVAAHALSLEQSGQIGPAMLRLAEIVPRGPEMTLTHQWLPDLVRLALDAGDRQLARAAANACAEEAASETRPARAAAASLRCRGLLESDPDPLAEAAAHYRTVGPAVELPAALEDLAVVLAGRGHDDDARAALNEAVGLYEEMQARWDVRRAEARLRPHGIKRGVRGRRGPRATSGWEALTPTEVKIAALVARGDSTSDIARGMFLSRRTVQTYISHILVKLQAKSRVDIVREALLRGVSP